MKIRYRFWVAVMIFMTTFTNYVLRSNISVSIVQMVHTKNGTIPYCLIDKNINQTSTPTTEEERYEWNEIQQGQILAGYFYGYAPTSVLAGIPVEFLGPKNVIIYSTIFSCIINSLIHLGATYGWVPVLILRILLGAAGGLVYPAINTLIARWSPPDEKSKFMATLMGNALGIVVTFNAVGFLTAEFGWPWGFHVTSIFCLLFCVFFAFLVFDAPGTHRWISEEERDYIIASQSGTVSTVKKMPPYLRIYTSCAFWAVTAAQVGNLWGLFLAMTYGPKYMSNSLGFNIKASAGLASLPYLMRLLFSLVIGSLADCVMKRQLLTVKMVRKGAMLFSHFLSAVCLFIIPLCGCMYEAVVSLIILTQLFNGAVVITALQNPHDLSPNYAGTVYGSMNAIASLTGFVVTGLSGFILSQVLVLAKTNKTRTPTGKLILKKSWWIDGAAYISL